jgi:hypothetical protein
MDNLANNVEPIRWSEQRYDEERAKFVALYGENDKEAQAKRDQALAMLFYRSGWTQERLAEKEGKGQTWVVQRLRFGRFLNFIATAINLESVPSGLTEGSFRALWDKTEKMPRERDRFVAVLDLLKNPPPQRKQVTKKVKAKLADGKWRSLDEMADEIEESPETIKDTVQNIKDQKLAGLIVERKKVAGNIQVRVTEGGKLFDGKAYKAKFKPLIRKLHDQAKGHMAHWSPAIVLNVLSEMEKLLDEWD